MVDGLICKSKYIVPVVDRPTCPNGKMMLCITFEALSNLERIGIYNVCPIVFSMHTIVETFSEKFNIHFDFSKLWTPFLYTFKQLECRDGVIFTRLLSSIVVVKL